MMLEAENQIRGAHQAAVDRLKQIRSTIEAMREQERLAYLRIKDCEAAGRVFGIHFEPFEVVTKSPAGEMGNVREFVLDYLHGSPDGAKSNAIAVAYKDRFGRGLHQKTIGMTLYRLLQSNAVARQGRIWRLCSSTVPSQESQSE